MCYKMSRIVTVCLLSVALIFSLSINSGAADFPSKPVKLVVPYGPGGGTDTIARIISGVIPQYLDQPMVILNKPGATGTVGTAEFKKMKADGYTLLINDAAAMSIKPQTNKLPYQPGDFKIVTQINEAFYLLSINADRPYKTIGQFIDYAKKNPGKIKYSSAGVGHIFHLAMEQAAKKAGIKVTHVPFKGTGKAVTATLGGHVDAVVCYPNAVLEAVKAGKLTPLAISAEKRQPVLPDVPTFIESGINYSGRGWKAIFARKSLPSDKYEILQSAFLKLQNDRAFKKLMKGLGEIIAVTPGEKFEPVWLQEYKDLGDLLTELGMKK
jgi:tripartite-type tricarboxylate transporter receptor subunit TctC